MTSDTTSPARTEASCTHCGHAVKYNTTDYGTPRWVHATIAGTMTGELHHATPAPEGRTVAPATLELAARLLEAARIHTALPLEERISNPGYYSDMAGSARFIMHEMLCELGIELPR